jgi:hypothetical protein
MELRPNTKSSRDIYEIEADAPIESVILKVNELITNYNSFTKSLSIQSNFDGYIAEDVIFAIGATVKIQHFLGIKPKWRIILLQVGNGVLTDIPSEWNDKTISLKNNGAVEVTATIFIARE